jgi:Holliday junction resolvasome RuvABC endonuclease subunit
MRFIGIDPSYTGFAVCGLDEPDRQPFLEHFIVTKPVDFQNRQARLVRIRTLLRVALIAAGPVRLAAVEGYSMGSKAGQLAQLGELGGMVRLELWERGIPFLDVSPSSLKSFVTGKGNAPKEIMLREVFRKWQYEAEDNNRGDAYGLAKFAQTYVHDGNTKVFAALAKKVVLVASGLETP